MGMLHCNNVKDAFPKKMSVFLLMMTFMQGVVMS